MRTTRFPHTSLLFGILAATFCLSASAHPDGAAQGDNGAAANNAPETTTTPARAAPPYDSDTGLETLSSGNLNTPEANGRRGEYYFQLGADAFRHKDYAHAIAMYRVAASWAYKPAEYNLALMYFRGQGVPVDRPRGAAWMVLAAERNTSQSRMVRSPTSNSSKATIRTIRFS